MVGDCGGIPTRRGPFVRLPNSPDFPIGPRKMTKLFDFQPSYSVIDLQQIKKSMSVSVFSIYACVKISRFNPNLVL